jgi:hypothetical protein
LIIMHLWMPEEPTITTFIWKGRSQT